MFNWVGNKLKYISIIKPLIKDFKTIIDPMMGSGNVLIQLTRTHNIIGCDIIKLLPIIYERFDGFDINLKCFKAVIDSNNGFKEKSDYYNFRDYWNSKYIDNCFDESFLVETFLLLKMCSNSMVRFNKKGLFNQGFRGTREGGFFCRTDLGKFVMQLEIIRQNLKLNRHLFFHNDVVDFIEQFNFRPKDHVFLFDPPYMLTDGFYSHDYTPEKEQKIFDFIKSTNIKFLLFNFAERNEIVYNNLKQFVEANDFDVIVLSNKSSTGQNRKGRSAVKEILITNIKA